MKTQLKKIIKRLAMAASNRRLIQNVLVRLARWEPEIVSRVVGRQVESARIPRLVDEKIERLLTEIPSDATLNERRFLYHFFSNVWSGRNTVIEVGPFLGGTTRAIALGMEDNPRISPDARLVTFDRFSHYHDRESLQRMIMPLVDRGVLNDHDVASSTDFMDLFIKIHQPHAYYARVSPRRRPLPDTPDLAPGEEYFALDHGTVSDAVFVDGCKSWFGTKYFMREVAKSVRVGTYFLFEDYGHYTCFWVAAFVALFREHFRLVSYVDDTYTFILTKSITAEEIDERFPDSPSALSESEFVALYDRLAEDARIGGDYYAVVRHAMHKAAALAYLGNRRRAKEILNDLSDQGWSVANRDAIKQALISPTYTPQGEIFLD